MQTAPLDPPPRLCAGSVEFPVHHVRGGTSTGLVISEHWAPRDQDLREELLRHLMGLPLEGTRAGNKQITGLGRIVPTGNKVFFARLEADGNRRRIVSTFAQLAADKAAIDWSVNCGNMTAALPLWALDTGQVQPVGAGEAFEIDIFNTNTNVTAGSRMRVADDGAFVAAEIPGVDGAFPAVDLFLADPVGAKTGRSAADRPRSGSGGRLRGLVRGCGSADGDRARGRFRQDGARGDRRAGGRSRLHGGAAPYMGRGRPAHGAEGRGRPADDGRRTRAERDDPESVHRRAAAGRRPHRRALFHAAGGASFHGGVGRLLPGGGLADPRFHRPRRPHAVSVPSVANSPRSMSG